MRSGDRSITILTVRGPDRRPNICGGKVIVARNSIVNKNREKNQQTHVRCTFLVYYIYLIYRRPKQQPYISMRRLSSF